MEAKKRKETIEHYFVEKKSKTESDVVTSNWMKDLDEKGYCVVPSVISAEKAGVYSSMFWDWIEGFKTGVDRNNPKTWTNSKLPPNSHGILHHFGIGHTQFAWDIRSEISVIEIFEKIWDTEKLLVSFDGSNFSRVTNRDTKDWPHVDQGPKKKGRACVQGLVNLIDSDEKDGGLLVYEGSHKLHQKFFEGKSKNLGDWYKYTPEEIQFFKDCPPIKICCKAGDLVLWDSRCVHFAKPPIGDRYRMVVYVSYLPASGTSEAQYKKKKAAFEQKRTTSHWAVPIKLFPKKPHTYGENEMLEKFVDDGKMPVLTKRGKQLAGLESYFLKE